MIAMLDPVKIHGELDSWVGLPMCTWLLTVVSGAPLALYLLGPGILGGVICLASIAMLVLQVIVALVLLPVLIHMRSTGRRDRTWAVLCRAIPAPFVGILLSFATILCHWLA